MNKFFLVLFPLFCFSQDRDGYQFMITHENELFVDFINLPNDDDNYTGGVKLELFTPGIKKWNFFIPLKNALDVRSTFAFSVVAFTPTNLGSHNIQYGDRPYASFTALSLGKEYYSEKSFLKSELYLGFLGLDLAKKGQSYIHDNHWFGTTRDVPNGWDHQIGESGVFAFNYSVSYLKHIDKISYKDFISALRLNASLGNYMIDAELGLNLAYNLHTSPFVGAQIPVKKKYNKRGTLLNQNDIDDVVVQKKRKFRLNAFIEPKLRHVLYNSTLEGSFWGDNSVYVIDHSDIRRYQLEFNTGINISFWDVIYLGAVVSGRSQEFKGGKKNHYWGGVSLGFRIE
ncbi:lipid A-modifier LpxR family protein [Wenyingzhuangia sp. IMCC45467]